MTGGRLRAGAAVATLAFLVWRLGTGPFLDGLQAVDGAALAAASGLAAVTTVCCAWRWRTVARGLGADLPLGTATVRAICTTWPAERSHATARSPWPIPRWTSPTSPPGSVTLRKIER